jgi:putative acetyltransferase
MSYTVSEMTIEEYDQVLALWKSSPAIILSKVDTRDCLDRFLNRNIGLSFVAKDDGKCIGAVLCSHDGRMGYLSHLVVSEDRRREGIGRQLVGRCLYALTGIGIHSCILLIMEETSEALNFWRNVDPAGGRINLVMMGPQEQVKIS